MDEAPKADRAEVHPDLRHLAKMARKTKNDLLKKTEPGDNSLNALDMQQHAHLYREDQLIARIYMSGDGFDSGNILHSAVIGYGADEVIAAWDAFGYVRNEAPDFDYETWSKNVPRGQLAKWFYSDDPAENARVTEALWSIRWKREGDDVNTQGVFQHYVYSKRKHRFRWGTIDTFEGNMMGRLYESVIDAMKRDDLMNEMAKFVLIEGEEDKSNARLYADCAVTKMLMKQGKCQIALYVKPEHRAYVKGSFAQANMSADIITVKENA